VQGREQAEQHAGADRDDGEKGDHAGIRFEHQELRRIAREQRRRAGERGLRDHDAERRTKDGEQQRLPSNCAIKCRAPRDRKAHGHFTGASRRLWPTEDSRCSRTR
jgi:hypothetical protein